MSIIPTHTSGVRPEHKQALKTSKAEETATLDLQAEGKQPLGVFSVKHWGIWVFFSTIGFGMTPGRRVLGALGWAPFFSRNYSTSLHTLLRGGKKINRQLRSELGNFGSSENRAEKSKKQKAPACRAGAKSGDAGD